MLWGSWHCTGPLALENVVWLMAAGRRCCRSVWLKHCGWDDTTANAAQMEQERATGRAAGTCWGRRAVPWHLQGHIAGMGTPLLVLARGECPSPAPGLPGSKKWSFSILPPCAGVPPAAPGWSLSWFHPVAGIVQCFGFSLILMLYYYVLVVPK